MYVSIRDCMLPASGLSDPFQALAALGLDSVELAVGKDVEVGTFSAERGRPFALGRPQGRGDLKALLAERGVSVSALLMANNFTGENYHDEVSALVTTCEAAEELGIPAVRVDMVLGNADMPEEQFVRRCADAVRTALHATSTVDIGVENHGDTSNRPELLDKVFSAAGDGRFGLTLDSGNFYWYGHPLDRVYEIMETYAGRVHHTHIKNISYPADMRNVQREVGYKYGEYVCPIYEGDIDHARVVEILRAGGYERGLTVEDESLGKFPPEQQAEILKKDVEHLAGLL